MQSKFATILTEIPGKSLSQQIYDHLLSLIVSRDLPVGTLLQERKLAEALEVSRTPAREALYRLESEGFISRQPGNSLIVREFSTRELIEILHVRILLEAEAVSLAIGRIKEDKLDEIEKEVMRLIKTASPVAEDDWKIDSLLHETIAQASGNTLLAKMSLELRLKTRMFNLNRVPSRFHVGHQEHLEIIRAIRNGDREAAVIAVRAHLEGVRDSIIRALQEI